MLIVNQLTKRGNTMKRVFKMIFLTFSIVALASLAHADSPSSTAKKYVNTLKKGDFAESYKYFTPELMEFVSKEQHIQFMELVKEEFGEIEKVKKCKLPIIGGLLLNENMFKKPKISYWNYCFYCENGNYHLRIEISKYKKEYLVSGSSIMFDENFDYERLQTKAKEIGIQAGDI